MGFRFNSTHTWLPKLFNAMIGVLLVGLGIDFTIHTLSRYSEERRKGKGKTPKEAIQTVYSEKGPSILTGALTTAAFFFAISVLESKALTQLGIMTGTGILVFFILLFVFYSAILVSVNVKNVPKAEMSSLERLGKFIWRHSKITLGLNLIITTALSLGILKIKFNYIMFEVFGGESSKILKKVERKFGITWGTEIILADSLKETQKIVSELERIPHVGYIDSVLNFIPKKQEAKLKFIEEIMGIVKEIEMGEKNKEGKNEIEFVKSDFIKELERFEQTLNTMDSWALSGWVMASGELKESLKIASDNFLKAQKILKEVYLLASEHPQHLLSFSSKFKEEFEKVYLEFKDMVQVGKLEPESLTGYIRDGVYLIVVYPKVGIWDEAHEFLENIKRISNSTGEISLFVEFLDGIISNIPLALLIGVISLFFILLLKFRSFTLVGLALTPLFLGWLWTIGIMGILGIRWDVMSIMAVIIIMGIGVDDGVHILHRYLREGEIGKVLRYTGRAVLITTLTTAWSFGSLGFGEFKAFKILSFIVVLGLFSFLLATLTTLPAILRVFAKNFEKGG